MWMFDWKPKTMIEVFRTNLSQPAHAELLLQHIHNSFTGCEANFDLSDCDRILRVKIHSGELCAEELITFLQQLGVMAEVLPDEPARTLLISPVGAQVKFFVKQSMQ